MKKIFLILLSLVIIFMFTACGEKESSSSNYSIIENETTTTQKEDDQKEYNTISIGNSIQTDAFTMSVDSIELLDEYEYNTSEYMTYSLYVEEGYKLLLVQGTMENTGSTVISANSFYKEAVVNNEYEVSGFDVDLEFERDTNFELDPYTSKKYDLYINIPEKLAEKFETVCFTLGFKDDLSTVSTIYGSDGTVSSDATNWVQIVK